MPIEKRAFEQATELVAGAQTVNVIAHIRPDADAIGSSAAMVAALQQLGKAAQGYIGQPEAFASNLLSIPGATSIRTATEMDPADLIIVLDCGSPDRTGAFVHTVLDGRTPVIVIDHHDTNPGYGTVNLLDFDAESTTTVLYEWFQHMGVELTPEIAHPLYAGLVTDTGSFRWGRPQMHVMAGQLMAHGINTRQIAAQLIDHTSVDGLRMRGRVLGEIRLEDVDTRVGKQQLAVLRAPHEEIKGLDTSEVESLVEYVRAIDGAGIGAVFKEYRPGWFAVSLRSSNDIDVSRIAMALGGGGHIRAAGYTTEGTFEENLARLKEAIAE